MSKNEKNYFKNCPKCCKEQGYTYKGHRDRAVKLNKICGSCASRKRQTGVTYSAEGKANISAARQVDAKKKRDACAEMYGEKTVYTDNYFTKWAKAVKTRDSYTCKRCNTVGSRQYIHAHHIAPKEIFPEKASEILNGVTLCNSCHQKIHADLDRITLSGIKLTQVGFQEHAENFISTGKTSSASTDVPPGYTSVFNPSVTITTE